MTATKEKLKLEKKKVILEEKKLHITTTLKEEKILTLKLDDLDNDAKMIVQAICFKMVRWQKHQLEAQKQAAVNTAIEKVVVE